MWRLRGRSATAAARAMCWVAWGSPTRRWARCSGRSSTMSSRLAIAREIGDWRGQGSALGNLGIAYCSLGEVQRAIEHYEQRLAIAREIGDRRGESDASWNLAWPWSNRAI